MRERRRCPKASGGRRGMGLVELMVAIAVLALLLSLGGIKAGKAYHAYCQDRAVRDAASVVRLGRLISLTRGESMICPEGPRGLEVCVDDDGDGVCDETRARVTLPVQVTLEGGGCLVFSRGLLLDAPVTMTVGETTLTLTEAGG